VYPSGVGSRVGSSEGAVGADVGRAVLEQIRSQALKVSAPMVHDCPEIGFSRRSLVPMRSSLPTPVIAQTPSCDQKMRASPPSRVHENRKFTQSFVRP